MPSKPTTGCLLVVAVAIVGCGGTQHTTTTRTQSERAQVAEEMTAERCIGALPPAARRRVCAGWPASYDGETVALCAHGLRTNGSCVFARRVWALAHLANLPPRYSPERTARVGGNVVDCRSRGSGWWCRSEHHPTWVALP